MGIFGTIGYFPIAAWVWGGGWIMNLGTQLFGEDSGVAVIDYAGGTAVHINAGAAALALALVLGKRIGFGRELNKPHNVPLTLLGAALLWFGWFGFNAGSALAANGIAALAFATTMLAPAGTLVVWTLLDLIRQRKSTAVGAATAIVVGLVAITPAAGFISPMSAIALGAIAAVPSYFALIYRARTQLDWSPTHTGPEVIEEVVTGMSEAASAPTPVLRPRRLVDQLVRAVRQGPTSLRRRT